MKSDLASSRSQAPVVAIPPTPEAGPCYLCLEMLDGRLRLWLLSMLVATFVFGLGYGIALGVRLIPV